MTYYQSSLNGLADLTWQTDKGIVLASALLQSFRGQRILLPTINVIEKICAEAITNASRRVYSSLTETLTKEHFQRLNALLVLKADTKITTLTWLKEAPGAAIVLWNTVYLERAIQHIKENGQPVNESLLKHLSPLGWEHINLTCDYVWQRDKLVKRALSGLYRGIKILNVLYNPHSVPTSNRSACFFEFKCLAFWL
jgi:hypothetical protein